MNILFNLSEGTSTSVATPPQKTKQTSRITKIFKSVMAVALLACPITWAALGIMRVYTYNKNRSVIEELGKNRHAAVSKVLDLKVGETYYRDVTLENLSKLSEEKSTRFHKKVIEIRDLLKNKPSTGYHSYMQKVRDKIDAALRHPAYEKLKEGNDPSVRFLQFASVLMNSKAHGTDQIENLGKKALEKQKFAHNADLSVKGFVDAMDLALDSEINFNIDDPMDKIFYGVSHPLRTLASCFGKLKGRALDYNAYSQGNVSTYLWTYEINGRQIDFAVGPTPTSDKLYEAQLDLYKKVKLKHLRHMLEQPGQVGEAVRRKKIHTMIVDKYPDTAQLMATPLDGKIWKSRRNFEKITTVSEFFYNLETNIFYGGEGHKSIDENHLEDNGFYLSHLKDEDIEGALKHSKEAFEAVGRDIVDPRRANKAMLLGFEGFLVLKTLINFAKDLKDTKDLHALELKLNHTLAQACKENVDRGVIMNIVTRTYFQLLSKGRLDRTDVEQMIGLVLMRGPIVNDRKILEDRYRALSDLLHLISENPGGFIGHLQEYLNLDEELLKTLKLIHL